jgi:hypothetical protein
VERGFYGGVAAALFIVQAYGQDTIYDEILVACGEDEVYKQAKRDGNLTGSGLKEARARLRGREKAQAEFERWREEIRLTKNSGVPGSE